MIIFLDESLVTSLNAQAHPNESILNALTICAQSAREGIHILMADRATFLGLEIHYPKMDARTVAMLRRSSDKMALRKSIRDFVCRAARLVSDSKECKPRRIDVNGREEIIIPASILSHESSIAGKPLLMVENINDGRAYLKLVRSIASDRIFPGLGWLQNLRLVCEIVNGGGNSLDKTYLYHKTAASRIGIAIADGDYRYPGGAPGQTALLLMAAAAKAPISPFLEAMILSVRTIENCIPHTDITRIVANLDDTQARKYRRIHDLFSTSQLWCWIPLKNGVRCFELGQTTEESKFWTTLFGSARCLAVKSCQRKKDCSIFIVPAISSQLLERYAVDEYQVETIEDCPPGIKDMWHLLLKYIYSIFCGAEATAAT